MIDSLLRAQGHRVEPIRTSFGALQTRISPRRSSGTPILFVHGLGRGGTQLVPLACAFSAARTTIVPDLLDLGGSSRSVRGATSIPAHADALGELLSQLDETNGPVDVVGVSLGGWVAAWLAARHPSAVRRLFLVNPAGLRADAEAIGDLLRSPARAPELYRSVVGQRPFVGVPIVSRLIEYGFRRTLGDPVVARQLDTVEEEHFIEHALARLACPTFALLSTDDTLLRPAAMATALLAQVKEIDGSWVIGASHNIGYEAFEVVVANIARFFGVADEPRSRVLELAAHLGMPLPQRPLREPRMEEEG